MSLTWCCCWYIRSNLKWNSGRPKQRMMTVLVFLSGGACTELTTGLCGTSLYWQQTSGTSLYWTGNIPLWYITILSWQQASMVHHYTQLTTTLCGTSLYFTDNKPLWYITILSWQQAFVVHHYTDNRPLWYITILSWQQTCVVHHYTDNALWVGYRIDPLPCHACRKRQLRQEQLVPRIKGLV